MVATGGPYDDPSVRRVLERIRDQIADDLLDVEGEEARTGKRVGKDKDAGKETFVSLLGPERARQQAELLVAQAIGHLDQYGGEADLLRAIARFAINRDH